MNFSLPQIVLARAALSSGAEFIAEVKRQKAAGTWDPTTAHYAAEGAKRYVMAIASGDLAPKHVIDERIKKCAVCPSRVSHPVHKTRWGSCGPAFVDRTKEPGATCGCPIEMACMVASKSCPQGKWIGVARVAVGPV